MATALVLAVLATVFNIAFGLFILVRNPRLLNARIFCLLSIAVSAWVVSNTLTSYYFGNSYVVSVSNVLAYFFAYLAVVLGVVFTYNFPQKREVGRAEATFVTLLSGVVLALSLTPLVAGRAMVDASGVITYDSGQLLFIYAIAVIALFAIVIRNLTVHDSQTPHFVVRQSKQVLMAFSLSVGFGLLINVILPMMGLGWSWTRLTPFITILFVGVVSYSIVRSGLFDIKVTIVRSFAYIMTFALLVLVYYGGAYVVARLFFGSTAEVITGNGAGMLLALVLAVLFQPIQTGFDKITNNIFYRGKRNHEELQTAISQIISTKTSLYELVTSLNEEIVSKIGAEASIMATMSDGEITQSIQGKASSITRDDYDALAAISKTNEPIVIDRSSSSKINKIATKLGIFIYMPLTYNDSFLGFLGIGDHKSNAYDEKDMRLLRNIATEVAVALQNARSLEIINNFNIELKSEIERATADLRASNRKLKAMDQTKDEFISLTSHQLRTPLTTIKGYISMLLDGDAGKLAPTQRKLLEEAFNSSQRMVHLISDFLNISRIQTGKFVVELSSVNLADILDEEIDQLRIGASSRQINLEYDKPSNFPEMQIDEGKIRQVMMNFIDNAIYYSPGESTIKIILSHTSSTVEFRVIDQGIGVPKAEQHKLFNKFSRASNARKQRPDGTGIGLFMAKKVVVALKGAIIFESVEGKGSTFGFRLNRS